MKVLYSWALANPGDWEECPAADFRRTPNRGVPAPVVLGQRPRGDRDNTPGYLSNLMVQGVMFNGFDHVAVYDLVVAGEDAVRVYAWNDDPNDPDQTGGRVARIWTFLPLAPDPTFGSGNRERLLASIRNEPGITEARRAEVLAWHHDPAHFPLNTRQSQLVYAEGDRYDRMVAGGMPVRTWDEFEGEVLQGIDPQRTRHGIWVPDAHWERQVEARTPTGWMHWNEHLPESECAWEQNEIRHNGRNIALRAPRRVLKEQRAQGRYSLAPHTITYYQRDTARAQGWIVSNNEVALELTTAGAASLSTTLNSGLGIECFTHATPASNPNSGDWPNGSYNVQWNITALSSGASWTAAAAFNQVSSDLATFIAGTGVSGSNTGTGLQLKTASWDPAAGNAGDRYAVHQRASGDSHGDAITHQVNTTDSYADGPWSTAAASPVFRRPSASVRALLRR